MDNPCRRTSGVTRPRSRPPGWNAGDLAEAPSEL